MKKNLKKVLAASLAATMVMTTSVVALADMTVTNKEDVEVTVSDMNTVTLKKTYIEKNEGTISPAETFSFGAMTCVSVEDAAVGVTKDNAPIPTINTVEYESGKASTDGAEKTFTITLPEYSGVGVYTYTFEEIDNKYAGVTYYEDDIKLVVTVLQDTDSKLRVAAVHAEGENDTTKTDAFTNVYSAGTLAVKKVVTGNMGDRTKDFNVKVEFTAPSGKTVMEDITYVDDAVIKKIVADTDPNADGVEGWTGTKTATITLKHDETVEFTNIPYGVTYTVEEDDYTDEENGGYDVAVYDYSSTVKTNTNLGELEHTMTDEDDGFEMTIGYLEDVTINNGVVTINLKDRDFYAHNVVITNNKGTTVDTGISLDNMPYLMVLAMTVLGAFGFVSKKRKEEDMF